MATIVLSAAGMALGGAVGGSVLGLSSAVIGRAVGASLGQVLDQRLLGAGSEAVEVGRMDRFRLTGASEGAAIAQIYGKVRIGGQVIWASEFVETRSRRGGKGAPQPKTTEYSYAVSLAIALCEGVAGGIGRIWADGEEVAPDDLTLRFYPGTQDQMPDPAIEAAFGPQATPAYRGTAYVVIEDLDLGRFGNRVPQFTFEVSRPAQPGEDALADLSRVVRAVALMPGSGEYALATSPVAVSTGFAKSRLANVNTAAGVADITVSLDALERELPHAGSASLIVSWFGGDLRVGECALRPKVEQQDAEGQGMPWRVSGIGRGAAERVAFDDAGNAVYGGTPADASVLEAIAALKDRGVDPVFYPFILMDQVAGNGLPDPYGGAEQAGLPWRGRITTALAPGMDGSTDGTAAAEAEVAAFFGSAQPGDFTPSGSTVTYAGPAEWSYRRFILHYAHLCALAGGVGAFCIGSEMRGLTQIRGANGSFPAVEALRQLAADCRAILGPEVRIGYAADWSEYHGYQPAGTADKLFHLDPLWADAAIDFIGIDNYMPLSDWRAGEDHADAHWGRIHNLDYLMANVAGGEMFDWYYHSEEARAAQIRTPITDGEGEPWVWRVKDLRGWWENYHHDRVDGERAALPTAWVPGSKPIWFTELGCGAIDKGTNQPNKFLDPKSSESAVPYWSNGQRDDLIQTQYLRAMHGHFADPANNPIHPGTGVRMVDMTRAHVWAWDARPWPAFPGLTGVWSDGPNYTTGHWITGRASARPLASVVEEICARAGVTGVDTSALYGLVRGYAVADVTTARAALQPLMTAYGFDVVERGGVLRFVSRDGRSDFDQAEAAMALSGEIDGTIERTRAPEAEMAGRVRIGFVEADASYDLAASEAALADDDLPGVAGSDLPLVLTRAEGQQIAERWLAEARVARDTARFALPPSRAEVGAGDVVTLEDGQRYRIDRLDQGLERLAEAVRVEPETYLPQAVAEAAAPITPPSVAGPVEALLLDLPLLTGDEVPHAPHIAVVAKPWPGQVALYSAAQDSGYTLNRLFDAPATVGVTQTALAPGRPGLWQWARVRVTLSAGEMDSRDRIEVLNGANATAIGDGTPGGWEVVQFREAVLVAPDTYDLTGLLRGQAGTDDPERGTWPVGSYVVLLDGAVGQIDLASSARGTDRHLRWGPAARAVSDPSYRYRVERFDGIGLRPYPVAHLRAEPAGQGDIRLNWIRRTRIDGDSWDGIEVPLGEAVEQYLVRVTVGGKVRREALVGSPEWTYSAAMQAADGPGAVVEVAQVSDRFGPGPVRRLEVAT